MDCGESDILVLEFDHTKKEKDGDISYMVWRRSLKVIQEEITKCEVRCANCHRRKTHKEKDTNLWKYLND